LIQAGTSPVAASSAGHHPIAHAAWLWCKWHGPIGYVDGLNKPRSAMTKLKTIEELFKVRHFDRGIVILCVRWYLRFKFKLSLRDLVEMMAERGLSIAAAPDFWTAG
jgi:hypothetical protein